MLVRSGCFRPRGASSTGPLGPIAFGESWRRLTGRAPDVHPKSSQAVTQVFRAGTPAQQAKAVEILTDTRRKIYEVLASDED